MSKKKFKEIEQNNGKIENSFIEYDEEVERWWDHVRTNGPEVGPPKVIRG